MLLVSFINAPSVMTQAADSDLTTIKNFDPTVHQIVGVPSNANQNTLSFTDEQFRNLKFFLAGGILTLLLVLICGLLRSSSTNQEVPPQVYAYQQPAQHFISSPPPIPLPAAPPTTAQPAGPMAEGEAHPQNPVIPSAPHGMYYPSIPLSLSMPVALQTPAYPAPAYPAPASHPQPFPQSETTSAQPETASPTPQKSVNDPIRPETSLPITDEKRGAEKPISTKVDSRTRPDTEPPAVEKKTVSHRDSSPQGHDAVGVKEDEILEPKISPILGDIITHTRYLKNLT